MNCHQHKDHNNDTCKEHATVISKINKPFFTEQAGIPLAGRGTSASISSSSKISGTLKILRNLMFETYHKEKEGGRRAKGKPYYRLENHNYKSTCSSWAS